MANTLRFKRGLVSGIPTALAGEPLFTTDTFDLYIGNGTGNTRFQKYIASGTTSQLLRGDGSLLTMPIVLTSPANGEVLKYNGTSWVNDSDSGITGSGTTNYLPKFTGASTLGDSLLQEGTRSIGLGVTPQTWESVSRALQVGTTGSISSNTSDYRTTIGANTYTATSGSATYLVTAAATQYMQISGTHRWFYAASGTAGNSITFTEAMRLTANGRLLLGTTTEGTQRLQVAGDTIMVGSGNTSGTTALTVQNSDGTNILVSLNNRTVYIGSVSGSNHALEVNATANASRIAKFGNLELTNNGSAGWTGVGISVAGANRTLQFLPPSSSALNASDTIKTLFSAQGASWTRTSGNAINFNIVDTQFAPTSGTATYYGLYLQGGVNQTGGANGISRGLFIDYNIVAAANWRSIETSNNTGWSYYGAGSAPSYFGGSVGIGTTALTGINLRIAKTLTGSTVTYGISQNSIIQSDVTASADYFYTNAATQATTFTLGSLRHFLATQGTFGAGSTVSNQYGFFAAPMTGATNNFGFFGDIASGTGRWNFYAAGTANNYFNGSVGIGTTSLTGQNLVVAKNITGAAITYAIVSAGEIRSDVTTAAHMYLSQAATQATTFTLSQLYHFRATQSTFGAGSTVTTQYGFAVQNTLIGATTNIGFFGDIASGTGRWNLYMNGTAANFLNGNTLIGSTTDSGEKLQVTGTMKVTGASTFGGNMTLSLNQNAATTLTITNTTSGTASSVYTRYISNTTSGEFQVGKISTLTTPYKTTSANDSFLYNSSVAGNICILNDFASGNINLTAGGSSTAHFTIASTGAATFSSSIQAATAIAIGTTPDTNKPFKILKSINGTVGINFENTSTGASAFSAIQMGTDVSGGTAFTNLVYSSSGVTAAGVYQPSGTSLINTGSGGLNFLSVSQPIRFFTSTGNGTERVRITNDGDITQYNGTNPSASTTDAFRMYSADVTAGNAAPHFRTENGAVVKIYQETTGVGNAIFSQGGGNSVLDDSTFDGYTLRQIVKALRNQGILA